MTINSCPDRQQWRSFLEGTLPTETASEMEVHLESCETCQQSLERAAAGHETWEGTAEQLAHADEQKNKMASSGHLRDVIDELKHGIDHEAAAWTVSPESLTFLKPAEEKNLLGRIGTYDVLEIIGHGGMGIVLKAWEPSLRRIVAIKVLASHLANSAAARKRFVREAQAAAAVTHDHVVPIHAVEASHDPPYLVMQFIEGKTLQQRLDVCGAMDVRELLRVGQQTAEGLAAAHKQGIVHRDIKPANILLENGVERVRITDFGLARAIDDASMTQSGVIAGTPLFMAPEQAQGQPVDHRSDLFSLGSVLYAMSTGRPPFRASTMMGVIRRVCDEDARPIREINPDIPDWLCGIIDRLLAKAPDERFQSADEVAELLSGCLAHVQHPLSVPLPAAAQSLAKTSVLNVKPRTPPRTPNTQSAVEATSAADQFTTAETERSFHDDWKPLEADEVKKLLRWPTRLMVVTGFLNAIFHLFIALYFFAATQGSDRLPSRTPFFFLSFFVATVLTIVAAYRVSRLQSLRWGLMAAVFCIIIGPAYPIGWPAGIWMLLVLGRADVRTVFGTVAEQHSVLPNARSLATPGRTMARMAAIAIIAVLGILIPTLAFMTSYLNSWTNSFEVRFYVFAAFGLTIMGLGALFRYGFGVGGRQVSEEQVARWTAGVRSPANWIGTFVSVAALMVMAIDVTGPFYEPLVESAVIPMNALAVGTLLMIAAIRAFRNQRRSHGAAVADHVAPTTWPVGVLFILVPALLLWLRWSEKQGYVHFATDSKDATIKFDRSGVNESTPHYGGVHRFRFSAGKYHWSVAEPGLIADPVEFGLVEVKAGETANIAVNLLGEESVKKVPGRWKCASYGIDWAAHSDRIFSFDKKSDGDVDPESTDLPAWARRPIWAEFSETEAVFHYADDPKKLEFLWRYNVNNSPKTLSLTVRTGKRSRDRDVAMGIWAVGRNSLVLKLEPFGNHGGLQFRSKKTNAREVEIVFEKPDDFTLWQGEWRLTSANRSGQDVPADDVAGRIMSISGQEMRLVSDVERAPTDDEQAHAFINDGHFLVNLDPASSPRRFSLRNSAAEEPFRFGLYEFSTDQLGDQLRICVSDGGYPSAITSTGAGAGDVAIYRRIPFDTNSVGAAPETSNASETKSLPPESVPQSE